MAATLSVEMMWWFAVTVSGRRKVVKKEDGYRNKMNEKPNEVVAR